MLARLLLSLLFAASLCAQNALLSAPGQTLNPGQTVVISLSLASAGQTIAALQFDIAWDLPLNLQITAGNQLQPASKTPYVVSLGPQSVRCLVTGINLAPIADGEVLKFFLSADPAASPGSAKIQFANIAASDPTGLPIAVNTAPVTVQIQNGTPVQFLPASAVLNAASLSPGPLSPGEIITLLGFNAFPSASIQINGVAAPILYAGANQINAIVPFGLDLTAPASLAVNGKSQNVNLTLPVAAVSPAIFTTAGAGLGPGAILNEDYTLNSFSNPAPAGSIVMLYGTGFGALQSPVMDGQAAAGLDVTVANVTATVAGVPADVRYAGAAPGLIAGLAQINVQLPLKTIHNSIAPIVLTIAGVSTINGVTVAIQ